jgi:hypothetical protein
MRKLGAMRSDAAVFGYCVLRSAFGKASCNRSSASIAGIACEQTATFIERGQQGVREILKRCRPRTAFASAPSFLSAFAKPSCDLTAQSLQRWKLALAKVIPYRPE